MHAHNFLINQGHQRHVVEAVVERLPQTYLVPSLNLIKESINSSDSLRLMITPQDDDLVRVPTLQSEQEADDFATLLASVDVITHEEVTGVSRDDVLALVVLVFVTHLLEHVQKVNVLAV